MSTDKTTRIPAAPQDPSAPTPKQRAADKEARNTLCDVSCALSTLAMSLDAMASDGTDPWEAEDRMLYLSGLATMLQTLADKIVEADDHLIEPEPLPGSPEAIAAAVVQPARAEAA